MEEIKYWWEGLPTKTKTILYAVAFVALVVTDLLVAGEVPIDEFTNK